MNDKGLDLSPLSTFNNKYGGMNNELQRNENIIEQMATRTTRTLQRL